MAAETLTPADVGTISGTKAPRAQALYDSLKAEEARLEAELKPYRDFYEKVMGDLKLAEARLKIKEINAKLGPIKNELAALARLSPKNKGGIKLESGHYSKQEGQPALS